MRDANLLGTSQIAVLAAAMLSSLPVGAASLSYDFSVTATNGPLSGVTENGTFSFDSSIIPAGGGAVLGLGLFSSLAFTWDAVAYTAATFNTGELEFDASGALVGWIFGTTCNAGGCMTNGGSEQLYLFDTTAFYATPADFQYDLAQASVVPAIASVPEPSQAALIGIGFAGWGVVSAYRRKKRGGR